MPKFKVTIEVEATAEDMAKIHGSPDFRQNGLRNYADFIWREFEWARQSFSNYAVTAIKKVR